MGGLYSAAAKGKEGRGGQWDEEAEDHQNAPATHDHCARNGRRADRSLQRKGIHYGRGQTRYDRTLSRRIRHHLQARRPWTARRGIHGLVAVYSAQINLTEPYCDCVSKMIVSVGDWLIVDPS